MTNKKCPKLSNSNGGFLTLEAQKIWMTMKVKKMGKNYQKYAKIRDAINLQEIPFNLETIQ